MYSFLGCGKPQVCKDVCKDPSKGATVYTTGKTIHGRRLFTETATDLLKKLTGGKKGESKEVHGKGTGYQVSYIAFLASQPSRSQAYCCVLHCQEP
jgi:hypothetical protein